MGLRVSDHAGLSDVGRQREANEDSFVVAAPVFAVADGMGGAQAGEVASRTAAAVFEAPRRGRGHAGAAPHAAGAARPTGASSTRPTRHESLRGMGTTLTAALVEDDGVTLAHVGDSRAYRHRDGALGAAHARPLARCGAGAQRPAHRRGRRAPSAALDHHPRAGAGARGRGRRPHPSGPRRRRLPALLGRADRHGLRRRDGRHPALGRGPRGRGGGARARRQPERGQGQHHGRAVPGGRGRGGGGRRGHAVGRGDAAPRPDRGRRAGRRGRAGAGRHRRRVDRAARRSG